MNQVTVSEIGEPQAQYAVGDTVIDNPKHPALAKAYEVVEVHYILRELETDALTTRLAKDLAPALASVELVEEVAHVEASPA